MQFDRLNFHIVEWTFCFKYCKLQNAMFQRLKYVNFKDDKIFRHRVDQLQLAFSAIIILILM